MKIDLASLTEEEQGYITGFYVGDGNIFIQSIQGIYRLRYFIGIRETSIQERLIRILSKTFRNVRNYEGKDNTRVVEIHSRQFLELVQKISNKNGLKNLEMFNKKFLVGFIEGLIDSDGFVQRNYTEITTMNNILKENILKILQKFDLKSNVRNLISPLSGKVGWRVGFSLKNNFFKPLKWVSSPQTAG